MISLALHRSPTSRQDFKITKTELAFAIDDAIEDGRLTIARLWTLLGLTNFYAWAIARRWGVIEIQEDDGMGILSDRLNTLIAASDAGLVEVSSSAEWLGKFLAKNWPKACRGPKIVRSMRQFMADLGIFEFTPGVKGQTVTSINLERVDFARLLILHEVCERALLMRCDRPESTCDEYGNWTHPSNLDIMPKHRGITGVLLFNAVFKGLAEYGRQDDGEERVIERPVVEKLPTPRPKYWEWHPGYKIPFGAWSRLLRRQLQRGFKYQSGVQSCAPE